MMDLDQANRPMQLQANALDWFALYGAVMLALRHPDLAQEGIMGNTRLMLEAWQQSLELVLTSSGLLTRADIGRMRAGADVSTRDGLH